MPANLENSAVATGLEKFHFHSSSKKGQCQRMFKLLHNCTHFICKKNNAENSPSWASTMHELRTSRCSSWIEKTQRNQRSNCQHLLDHRKSKKVPEKHLFLLYWLCQSLCVDHNKLWKILKEMGIPVHLTCLMSNYMQVKKKQLELGME